MSGEQPALEPYVNVHDCPKIRSLIKLVDQAHNRFRLSWSQERDSSAPARASEEKASEQEHHRTRASSNKSIRTKASEQKHQNKSTETSHSQRRTSKRAHQSTYRKGEDSPSSQAVEHETKCKCSFVCYVKTTSQQIIISIAGKRKAREKKNSNKINYISNLDCFLAVALCSFSLRGAQTLES